MDSNAAWQSFLTHAELTDVGLRRSNNQDSFGLVIAPNADTFHRRGHLFIVADGMGAHAAGELASKMAVDTITLSYYKLPDAAAADCIRKAIEEANNKIHSRGQANPDFRGMGTTTSALVVLPQGAMAAHVGDSRVYRLRGNRFEQLTADHSLVWEMMANSKMTEQEVPGYIPKNIITRSLGPSESVQVDVEGPFPLVEGDTFLLCSDGLSGQVPDDEMGVILGVLPPHEAVRVLVDLANLRGGPDNITVEIVRIGSLSALPGKPRGGSSGPGKPVSVVPAVAFGVLLVGAGVLAAAGQWIAAAVSGVAGLATALGMLIQRVGGGDSTSTPSGQYGRGPHRSWVCPIDVDMVNRFSAIIEPVCRTARDQHWEIDWEQFQAMRNRAQDVASRGDFAAAVREHCHAISFMMEEVRDQRRRAAGSTTIDIEGP